MQCAKKVAAEIRKRTAANEASENLSIVPDENEYIQKEDGNEKFQSSNDTRTTETFPLSVEFLATPPRYVDIEIINNFIWPVRHIKINATYKQGDAVQLVGCASCGPFGSNQKMMERLKSQLEEYVDDDGYKAPLRIKHEDMVKLQQELVLHLDWGYGNRNKVASQGS